jgi:RNA-binding protein with serine-rich domain 1
VSAEHLKEIFGVYGVVKNVELQIDRRIGLSKGFGYVTFEKSKDAEQAVLYLDGGQIDGNVIKVSFVLVSSKRRRESPGK